MLSDKFKPQHNDTIVSLKYWKLYREQNENAEEWTGHLRIKGNGCWHKENDRRLNKQFLYGITQYDDSDDMRNDSNQSPMYR